MTQRLETRELLPLEVARAIAEVEATRAAYVLALDRVEQAEKDYASAPTFPDNFVIAESLTAEEKWSIAIQTLMADRALHRAYVESARARGAHDDARRRAVGVFERACLPPTVAA